MNKFEHGFGTQLGAVLLWRRVRSRGFMLAAWSHQTTTAGGRQKTFFLEFRRDVGEFLWISLHNVSARN